MTLTPGQRLDLKKRIAQTLAQQEWGNIDLTLGEFGLPTTDDWRGNDREDYVRDMLRGVTDEAALQQLDSYLHPAAAAPAVPQPHSFDDPTNPWVGNGLRLFLSHEHTHAKHAGELRQALARRSVDAFVAHDSIEPTEEWKAVILNALRSCDACLAFLTPAFPRSEWCDQEIGFSLARERLVISVEYGQIPYGFIGDSQSLRVKDGQESDDIALAVFEVLVRKKQSRDAMAHALVARWASTESWDEARENYSFLRKIPKGAWTQNLVTEVWNARERVHDLRTANINWQDSEQALHSLFEGLTFERPRAEPDDVPF